MVLHGVSQLILSNNSYVGDLAPVGCNPSTGVFFLKKKKKTAHVLAPTPGSFLLLLKESL